jgi:hypothetical protein
MVQQYCRALTWIWSSASSQTFATAEPKYCFLQNFGAILSLNVPQILLFPQISLPKQLFMQVIDTALPISNHLNNRIVATGSAAQHTTMA